MNPAVATVIAAAVGVVGAIIGAVISSFLNRDKDDADIAEKVSQAWDPVFQRMDKDIQRLDAKCTKCETELISMKRIGRVALRAHVAKDQGALDAAMLALGEILDE